MIREMIGGELWPNDHLHNLGQPEPTFLKGQDCKIQRERRGQ